MEEIYEIEKENDDLDKSVVLQVKDYDSVGWYFDYYNQDNKVTFCKECGKIFKKRSNNDIYCRNCADNVKYYEPIETKEIICIDCGKEVEVKAWDMKTCRCEECQHEEDKRIKREYKRRMTKSRTKL